MYVKTIIIEICIYFYHSELQKTFLDFTFNSTIGIEHRTRLLHYYNFEM